MKGPYLGNNYADKYTPVESCQKKRQDAWVWLNAGGSKADWLQRDTNAKMKLVLISPSMVCVLVHVQETITK